MDFRILALLCSYFTIGSVASRQRRDILPPALLDFREKVTPIMQTFIAKNTLALGESCNIRTEALRKAHESRLLTGMTLLYLQQDSHSATAQEMLSVVQELAALPGAFCDTFQNLECGPTFWGESKCQCAKVSESVGFVANFKREANTCVLTPQSMCAPQEIVDESSENSIFGRLPSPKVTCAKGTSCVVKRTGAECNAEALQREFDRMTASHAEYSNPTAFTIAKSMEGICICRGFVVRHSLLLIVACLVVATAKYLYN